VIQQHRLLTLGTVSVSRLTTVEISWCLHTVCWGAIFGGCRSQGQTLYANSLIYKYFTGKSLFLKDLGEDGR
jgi:hypothetical protein